MFCQIIKSVLIILFFLPFSLFSEENAPEIGYREPVPWVDFTNFELELVARLIDYFNHAASFKQFECYFETIKQEVISEIVNPYYDYLETLRPNPKKFNLYRIEIWKLEKALKFDLNHVIHMTCTLIENKEFMNYKIHKAFSHWSRDTLRISYPLLKLNPDSNPLKILKFLEQRFYKLYFYIQAYVAYKNHPSDKNANILNMHIEEISAFMN